MSQAGDDPRDDAIAETIDRWHRFLRGGLPGGLDELLADDVVFHSPIVFSPQKGAALTKLYLQAAGSTFGGGQAAGGAPVGSGFRYCKEVLSGRHAVLEFEAEVEGVLINGVDILTCDDEGRIVEFKVMIRPLKAIELMHRKMREMLEKLKSA